MEKLPLFNTKKEFFFTLLVLVVFFFISLLFEFQNYKKITIYSLHVSELHVKSFTNKISKKGKKYNVLKLKNSDFTFYTTTKEKFKIGDELRVAFRADKLDFYHYLKGFFAYSKKIEFISSTKNSLIKNAVKNQHLENITQELYGALFFALPISKELREDITKWGIAHLVAISGFHLGILSAILFFLIKPIYTFFQDRFFPYRNSMADLALIVFLILGIYTYLIDMTPSVLRAYVMSLVGFFLYSKNIKILSFVTLLFTTCIVLILFPKLLFSLAFWFSISGVFYIFLFLHHFSALSKIAIFILLHFWVYILMLPIIHYFFEVFSFYQLFSPIISMLFILFYPLSLALHVIGFGDVLDSFLVWFFNLNIKTYFVITPFWFLTVFLSLSFFAIRFRVLSIVLPFLSLSLFLI